MPGVDPGYAGWLRGAALFSAATSAGTDTAWGERATISEIVSPLALKAAADTEAARQQALTDRPMAIDKVSVPGLRADLLGQPVTLKNTRFGYASAPACLVIGVAEQDNVERTVLTVLRRL